MSDLARRAESFLFLEGGSLTLKKLAQLLACRPEELAPALEEISEARKGSGIALIRTETEAALVVSPESRKAVQKAFERELGKEIGEAGLEVLSIVLYRGPSTRAQIDYIRGVNSGSTIRTLLARGLVERAGNPEDSREYLYRPTVELLAHLGVEEARELPEYATITGELSAFEAKQNAENPFNHEGGAGNSSID